MINLPQAANSEQYAGSRDAEKCNKRYQCLTKNGQTGLGIAFDALIPIGRNPGHSMSYRESGKRWCCH